MHYRFIILAALCLSFWVNPVFGNEEENPGSEWTFGDKVKYVFSAGYYTKETKPRGTEGPVTVVEPVVDPESVKNGPVVVAPMGQVVDPEAVKNDLLAGATGDQVVGPEPVKNDPPIGIPEPTPPISSPNGVGDPPPANSNHRKKDPGCEFIGAHAIADWLNSINIGSFFDYASRHVLRNDECFVILDSRQSLTIWIEPYGFNAHYRSPTKSKNVDLTLSSIGTSLGASYALFDELHLGGGAGYFHSNFDSKGDKDAHINGVYFGPSVEYLFSEGSVGFMIMGIGNFYGGQRKIGTECETHKYNTQSWDLDMRLEAEYDLHPPTEFFIKDLTLHPFVRIDYLNVFERGSHQKGFDLKAKHSSFFYSKLSMRFEKMVLCNKSGFLTSNVDVGWVNMTPLSSDAFEWKAKEKDKVVHLTTESKNQCALGLEFVGGYHNGLLAGIGYQATIGASSPMQTGRVRIEWNW